MRSRVLELADAPGRQRTRLIRLAVSPPLRPGDNWEAASTVVTNGPLKASRKMNRNSELLCDVSFLQVLFVNGPV
jgi:hypothetical protein